MNENELMKARLSELARRADERGYTTFSEFLNLNEISLLKASRFPVPYRLDGGYDSAERCVAAFGAAANTADMPIVCLRIVPLQQKFADKLTHRDVLGALMHLGIERSTLGDILLHDNTAYLFCLETMAPYILQNLTRIRHTTVQCRLTEQVPQAALPQPESQEIIVPSLRVDAVISAVYKLSRNETAKLFASDKIFINASLISKESVLLKEGNIVSVRGYGRFHFDNTLRTTKKNRMVISVRIYR